MSSEALAAPADGPREDHYEAFYSVLASSARGRAFLAEHARRARHAETETLLAALARIETTLAEQRAQSAPPPAPAPAAPANTALAAIAAQAIAAAESDLPVMRVIKAGQMPPPARFAGDDFAAEAPAALPVDETDAAAASDSIATEMQVADEAAAAPADHSDGETAAHVVADDAPDEHVAPPGMLAGDALAALLALSDDERLALFS